MLGLAAGNVNQEWNASAPFVVVSISADICGFEKMLQDEYNISPCN